MIETEQLTKSYGSVRGIEDVTIAVEAGEVFGILGLDALLDYINDEQRRAAKRLKNSGDSPIAMSIATAAYESPRDAPKAH